MKKNASAIALGFFDGVHTAHQKIIGSAVQYAKEHNLEPIMLTFSKAPTELFNPEKAAYITTAEEKARLAEKMGARAEFLQTDEALLNMEGEEFVREILLKKYNMRCAVCGGNYRFGKGASSGTTQLTALGEKYGFDTIVVENVKIKGESVSSTLIRKLLSEGRVKKANELLTRSFSLTGKVEEGKKLGRKIGFPTANVFFPKGAVHLKNGVYMTNAVTQTGTYRAITNVGVNPTFGGEAMRAETYIPNFCGNLYGKTVKIEFTDFIREEKRFENIEDLKEQIEKDVRFLQEND